MSVTKEQVKEFLSSMSVLDLAGLVKELEDEWGVTAAAPVAMAAAPAADAAAAEEQTEFAVVLEDFGSEKIKVIKEIRPITGLGLKEAKELVESAPTNIKEAVQKEEAEEIKKKLEAVGAKIVIK